MWFLNFMKVCAAVSAKIAAAAAPAAEQAVVERDKPECNR
jgi:hypothetical protein